MTGFPSMMPSTSLFHRRLSFVDASCATAITRLDVTDEDGTLLDVPAPGAASAAR